MVLYIIGLGLGDERDITVRGLERIKSSKSVFLEYYTSILGVNKERLELFYETKITIADRNMVENEADLIYSNARNENVAFLVVGDPLCATTHVDLMLRAKQSGIVVEVVHNASVMNGVASCGLPLYQYGYTISIPFFETNWKPASFYERIVYNKKGGMHTLCLLDIKVKEPDYDSMINHGKTVYLPPRFMTVNVAIAQLFELEKEMNQGIATPECLGVGMARLGQSTQKIVFGTLEELIQEDFGEPLHSLALCADIHPVELEILNCYRVVKQTQIN